MFNKTVMRCEPIRTADSCEQQDKWFARDMVITTFWI